MAKEKKEKEAKNKKAKKNIYPSKYEINFVTDKKEKQNRATAGIIVLLLILLAIFVKIGIIDQIAKVNKAKKHYQETEELLENYKSQIVSFKDVLLSYDEITGAFMMDSESILIDRIEILDVIEEDIFKYSDIQSIVINDKNVLKITTSSTTVSTVSEIARELANDHRISYVTTRTAKVSSDEDSEDNLVIATFEIGYIGEEEESTENEE